MEYYSAIKRNAFESDLGRCLNLEPVTEWSKSEKETQISYINIYTYIWNLEKWYGCTYLLEKAMAPHSSTLAWKIPWTEEPGGLQSMGSLRVGHDWATSLSLFHFHALEKEMATHSCSCLENPRDGGAWWAAVYGVAQSRTRLKWLSSSSSIIVKNGTLPKCAAVEE